MRSKYLLLSAFTIPLNPAEWAHSKFRNIPPNQVEFSQDQLHISVNSSASPLFFKLPKIKNIQSFHATLSVEGKLKDHLKEKVGKDSYLRVGFLENGTQRLSWFQKQWAPQWILDLYKNNGDELGAKALWFFNIAHHPAQVGTQHRYKKSIPITEHYLKQKPQNVKSFSFEHRLENPLKTSLIWLSSDGDDTQSKFKIHLKKLEINTL